MAFAAVILLVPLLAGCVPEAGSDSSSSAPSAASATPTAGANPTGSTTPTSSPTPTQPIAAPAPDPAPVFTMPSTCSELAGPDLEAVFASRNAVLFNSSNTEGIYAGTPVDTHQQGGSPFGCLWGVPNVDLNTFVISVQSLSHQAHEGVVSILDGGGYVKSVNGDTVTYTQLGDEFGQPSGQLTIHVLRGDSWMTGWAALGGETMRGRITGYLDAVAANLYN